MSNHDCTKNIVIIGLSGTGKSSVGAYIARKGNMDLYDTDYLVETITGMTISELFSAKGEKYFREIERQVVNEVAAADSSVIACGGGTVLDKISMELLRSNGYIFCLWAELNELERRLSQNYLRPLLQKDVSAQLRSLMIDRVDLYRSAHFHINTQEKGIHEVGDQILDIYLDRCQKSAYMD